MNAAKGHTSGAFAATEPVIAALVDVSRETDILGFAATESGAAVVEQALLVRAVENALLGLFGKGKLHGTIHTCVGQELTGAILGAHLRPGDFITSNHRCHGHFIGATGNWKGLVDELVGNADGVCAGIGSSQHLHAENFISNGQQGGLLPVAAGVALARKRAGKPAAVVSFIGEGTLGEGVLYETMNLDALWRLPHVIVCENNGYSQSTPQQVGVAGDIRARAAAFGILTLEADTWHAGALDQAFAKALEHARSGLGPVFLQVRTYRLNPHSKGDDLRSAAELAQFGGRDPLNVLLVGHNRFQARYEEIVREVEAYAEAALEKPLLNPDLYFVDELPRIESGTWRPVGAVDGRMVQQLNQAYAAMLRAQPEAMFIGEDISDPYGGAFKVSKGLETEFGARVISTPISEAGIVGVGVGLALAGCRPLVEIMFGDFMTLTLDQILNNASKFRHMFNHKVSCPLVVRAPMGGRRGYGPTHSQSLERFFTGIDNCVSLSLNSLAPAGEQLSGLASLSCPAIIFENKIDYTLRTLGAPEGFVVESDGALLPTFRVRPESGAAKVTIVSYGGMARLVADNMFEIFDSTDLLPELIAPTALHPLNLAPILESARSTGRLVVVEEGGTPVGVGAEIVAATVERLGGGVRCIRIGARPAPVPSAPHLEAAALPDLSLICERIASLAGRA